MVYIILPHHDTQQCGNTRGITDLLLLVDLGGALGAGLLLALALLQERLGDENAVARGDGGGSTVSVRLVRSPAYRGMVKSADGELLLKRCILALANSSVSGFNQWDCGSTAVIPNETSSLGATASRTTPI